MSRRLETTLFGLTGSLLGTGSVLIFGLLRGWPADELIASLYWGGGGGVLFNAGLYACLLYRDLTRGSK